MTTLTAGIPSLIVALRWLRKQYGVTVDWASSGKILLSGGTAWIITYALVTQLTFSNLIALVVGTIVFLFVFLAAIVLVGAITQDDVDTLREIMTVLGPLGRFADFVLNIIERLMIIFRP